MKEYIYFKYRTLNICFKFLEWHTINSMKVLMAKATKHEWTKVDLITYLVTMGKLIYLANTRLNLCFCSTLLSNQTLGTPS
jgi:hypothetical protein